MKKEIFEKKKKDEKFYGARDAAELERQLAQINRAAHDAMRSGGGDEGSGVLPSYPSPASLVSSGHPTFAMPFPHAAHLPTPRSEVAAPLKLSDNAMNMVSESLRTDA